ncbi:hypothetical protein LINPERPRIM_LOCUS14050 [Linum perenne]
MEFTDVTILDFNCLNIGRELPTSSSLLRWKTSHINFCFQYLIAFNRKNAYRNFASQIEMEDHHAGNSLPGLKQLVMVNVLIASTHSLSRLRFSYQLLTGKREPVRYSTGEAMLSGSAPVFSGDLTLCRGGKKLSSLSLVLP